MGLAGEPENVCCGAMIKYWCVAQGTVAGFIQYETPLKSWDHACGVLCEATDAGSLDEDGLYVIRAVAFSRFRVREAVDGFAPIPVSWGK